MFIKSLILATGLVLSSVALAGTGCDCQIAKVENAEQIKVSEKMESVKAQSGFALVYAVTVYQEGAVMTKFEQSIDSSIVL